MSLELSGEVMIAQKNLGAFSIKPGDETQLCKNSVDREDEAKDWTWRLFRGWVDEEEVSILFCKAQHWPF